MDQYVSRSVIDADLQAPTGLKGTVTADPRAMAIDSDSPTPLGTCTIAGVQAPCLIDSGNSAMSMSLELAEQLHLQPVGMLHIAGLGDYATEVVRAGPLQMGGVRFGDANYIVLSDIHRYGYDLVIGADVLASMPVTIDFHQHMLYFTGETAADMQGITVPIAFRNFVPVVNVTLANRPTHLTIDTGDQSTINLSYEYYQRHPELFRPQTTQRVSGVGGNSVELIGQIPSVHIGALTAQNQQIGTTESLKGTADGHLGAGFLSQYRVVLDYAHELVRLLPIKPM